MDGNLKKLLGKLAAFVENCGELYGIRVVYRGQVKMKHVKKLRKKLYALKEHLGRLFQYKKIVTDAGYESEENYSGLESGDFCAGEKRM